MKTKLLKLLVAMTISITALFALGLSAGAAQVGDLTITLTDGGEPIDGTDYTYENNVITIKSSAAMTISGTTTTNRIEVADGVSANITLAGVNIDVSGTEYAAAFKIADNSAGNVTITLADNTTNTLKSGPYSAGLQKNSADESVGKLTICGTGSLSAQGGRSGAGIGGGSNGSAANITITDKAVVTATGSAGGAGIGGGFNGTLEDLIISGGSVNAIGSTYSDSFYGDSHAPAIGSGVLSNDYGLSDGESVTPTLADGTTPVYLLEIDNPNGEDIVIDGVDYPDSHGSETKIYAYVTAENHTVKVGNTSTVYEYNNGSFIEFVHGTQFSVSATKSGETLVYGKDYTYSQRTKVLNILSDKAITIANADSVYEADDHINVAKNINADITLAGVYINVSSGAAFAIEGYGKGNVTVTLAEGSVNVLQSGEDFAGIDKNDDESTLTITGEGSLTAQGGAYAPGIGAGEATSNITIKGGNITATGGSSGAGIGGGYNGTSRNITITGTAVVTATGAAGGAGIGGGFNGTLEDLIISGGSVKAVGSTIDGVYAPAIGSGVMNYDYGLFDGESVTPTLADGRTLVYLFEISNPNGADISIDGVDYPDSHGSETKIYAYVAAENHTVKVGDTSTLYEYLNGAFTEMVHGTQFSVSATNSGETLVHGVDYTYSSATGILTVLTDKAMTIANTDPSTPTTNRIEVANGVSANITLAGVNINAISGAAFRIADNSTGNVTLTLADGSVNTLNGASYYAGLQKNVTEENVGTLTICGTGSLSVQGGTDSAGIGGANKRSTGNITISGGVVVTATGGVGSAGIGGGYGGSAKDITITDNAVVTATGDTYGAGIGSGYQGSATGIKISDNAVVTASGKEGAAGIGGGVDGTLENIIINGGSVNATGSYYYEQTVGGADGANIGNGVTLPSGSRSDPEEGAPATPTLADSTTPVYLLELDVDGTSAVTINGKAYPTKHIDENKLYVYLPVGYYTVANGGNKKLYHIADNGTASEVVVGTAFTITGTDLVYGTDYTYPANTGVLTILSPKAVTIANANPSTPTTDTIVVADGVSANITLAGVNIDVFSQNSTAAFKIADNSKGNVTIALADGTTNTLKSGEDCAGLQKNGAYISETQGKLTIKGGTAGTGILDATGGNYGAGIGGGYKSSGSNITIEGGEVTANGGKDGAGIGGGYSGSGSNITIKGGTVTATGGKYGAGIGGGYNSSSSNITIEGGEVTANGGEGGAGIGGGGSSSFIDSGSGSGSNITIKGGTVKATGGDYGAGIGGGYNSSSSNITIEGGEVTANGGEGGAGIGGGYYGSGSNITISGGSVKAVAGTVYQNCVPAAIGQGVQYDGVYSNGAEVTPTDGTDNVYLIELDVDGTNAVTINGKAYPTKHFDENKVYIYLPAKTAQTPNEVTVGNETTKYTYDTTNSKWLVVVDAPEADTTKFTYNGEEHTYTLAENENYTITGNKQTNAGTYTVTVALKDGYIWNDGETAKEYTFTIAKAAVTVTAKSYTIKAGDTLPTYAYDVTGLVNGETLPIDVTISCTADGKTAGTYDIVVSGAAEAANYAITYVNGVLTVEESNTLSDFVNRLYSIFLGRKADETGLADWTEKLSTGKASAAEIVHGIAASPEFQAKGFTNAEVVEKLYEAMLNRASDAEGKANWVKRLDAGMTVDVVINGFTGSQEFAGVCAEYGIKEAGSVELTAYRDQNYNLTAFVSRMYTKALGRPYDLLGLEDWSYQLYTKKIDVKGLAFGFIFSPEFTNKNLDDSAYLDTLYHTFFDREPDEGGKANWLEQLKNGTSREDVMYGFVGSQECINLVASFGI